MKFESQYHDDNRFFILTDFDDDLRNGIVIPLTAKIEELKNEKDPYIEVYINSYGGDGDLCMHLVHLLELAQARDIVVRTIVTQNAYSAGSLLAVVGTPGERYIANTAEHIMHYGSAEQPAQKTPLQIDRTAGKTKRWFQTILNHYKRYAAVPDIEEVLKDDFFAIPAQRCMKWKLADKDMLKL